MKLMNVQKQILLNIRDQLSEIANLGITENDARTVLNAASSLIWMVAKEEKTMLADALNFMALVGKKEKS